MTIGLADDIRSLPPWPRVVSTGLAGGIAALGVLSSGGVLPVVTGVILGLACANAVNIVDGQDGLAGGLALIASVSMAVAAYALDLPSAVFALGLATAGGLLGFLIWNRPPARLFLGNGGAYGVGTLLAVQAVVLLTSGVRGFIAAGLSLEPFAFELVLTTARRRMLRTSLVEGDRLHSYDLLAARLGYPSASHDRPVAHRSGLRRRGVRRRGAPRRGGGDHRAASGIAVATVTGLMLLRRTTMSPRRPPLPQPRRTDRRGGRMNSAPTSDDVPALLGAPPLFPEGLALARPAVRDPGSVRGHVDDILASGVLTDGPLVRQLEERAADYLGVRHCVAVGSCTAGLMLVLRAADLMGDVLVPSFTFAATAHAVAWNGLRPVFVDIRSDTLTMSPEACERAIDDGTSAILAAHIFGTPCDVEAFGRIAKERGLRLFFDAAHAFGSRHGEQMVGGFGDAEVFSLSPTKVLVAGEGGLIATNDDLLAERCRIGRNYGNPGDYDCLFVGLNARMSEFHAAVALASFDDLEDRLTERQELAAAYRGRAEGPPGDHVPDRARRGTAARSRT